MAASALALRMIRVSAPVTTSEPLIASTATRRRPVGAIASASA